MALLRDQRAGDAFGNFWGIFAIQDIAENLDCRSRGRRGGGVGGRWALGLLYPEKSPCLMHPPFWDRCDPLGCRMTPQQDERPFLLPQPLVLLVLQRHHTPSSCKMELQGRFPGLISTSLSLHVPRCSPHIPAAPTVPALDSPSSSSPDVTAHLGPGSPSRCQSQQGHGHGPVVTVPSSPWTGRK